MRNTLKLTFNLLVMVLLRLKFGAVNLVIAIVQELIIVVS